MTHDLEPETKKKSDANGSVQVLMLMVFVCFVFYSMPLNFLRIIE